MNDIESDHCRSPSLAIALLAFWCCRRVGCLKSGGCPGVRMRLQSGTQQHWNYAHEMFCLQRSIGSLSLEWSCSLEHPLPSCSSLRWPRSCTGCFTPTPIIIKITRNLGKSREAYVIGWCNGLRDVCQVDCYP